MLKLPVICKYSLYNMYFMLCEARAFLKPYSIHQDGKEEVHGAVWWALFVFLDCATIVEPKVMRSIFQNQYRPIFAYLPFIVLLG